MTINKSSPLVSVCIPVFNGENYIAECICSVLEQDFTNFELIVIDNFSTDSTQKIIDQIDDKRIRYIKNKVNIGSINNFNKCIENASGEYFLLLSHDDRLLPGALMTYVNRFEDTAVGIVYSSIVVINEVGKKVLSKVNHKENQLFTPEEAINDIVCHFHPIQQAMVRAQIIKQLKGFDSSYSIFCDIHLWARVIFCGWKSFYNNEPLSCHRVHSEQGQKAFLRPNLDVLSEHMGRKLDKGFWIDNLYNNVLLKLISFLLSEMKVNEYDVKQTETLLLKLLAYSHLRNSFLALMSLNGFILWQELLIFKRAIKQFGFLSIFLVYPQVIIDIVKKIPAKIKKKITYKSFSGS